MRRLRWAADLRMFAAMSLRVLRSSCVVLFICVVGWPWAGCNSVAKSERSSTIVAGGNASIEGVKALGLSITHLFVLKIDGQLVQPKGTKGVYALLPGPHEIQVQCNFSRVPIAGPMIDAGGAVLRLEAKSGARYRLAGKKLNNSSAELWIDDVTTGWAVTGATMVALEANQQEMPVIPVYLPKLR